MYPHLFKTNFKSSDGIDLGEKFVSRDYLFSSYPNLLNNLSASTLFEWGFLSRSSGNASTPRRYVNRLGKVKQVHTSKFFNTAFATRYFSAIIKSDGSLWSAGDNEYGQLGLNNNNPTTDFTRVGTDFDWKQVYCGCRSTVAIKTDGSLWATGYNLEFQLGLGDQISRKSFVRVGYDNDWKYACIGGGHGLAIKENGSLWSWGRNTYGLLGIDNTLQSKTIATPNLVNNQVWKYIDTSNTVSCGITSSGSMWIWGNSTNFMSGKPIYYKPTIISYDAWKTVSVGFNHASAIKMDGSLWSTGNNEINNLGINNALIGNTDTFLLVAGGSIWKQVACGNYFSIALRSDGTLWSWGNNINGQGGRGDVMVQFPYPVGQIGGYWRQVCCSSFGAMGIKINDYI